MPQAFLSYSRDDRRWVSLVKHLLDFHHVAVWLDRDRIRPGCDYRQALASAIEAADMLLVVAGAGAPGSSWVEREISSFQAVYPQRPIVPLVFDDVELDDIFDGLGAYQAISFLDDLDVGFVELFKYLGVDFLAQQDRRTGKEDRRGGDRRVGDRRRADVRQRLRRGLWKEFQRRMEAGEYEEFGLVAGSSSGNAIAIPGQRDRPAANFRPVEEVNTADAILRYARILAEPDSEISHYLFRDRGSGEPVELAYDDLYDLIHRAYRHQEETGGRTANVYVVERVALLLNSRFDVAARNRRSSDRRVAGDRRTDS